jgi:Txe/YoeB family toxin of Txe-Axe toxin-antitoxin module
MSDVPATPPSAPAPSAPSSPAKAPAPAPAANLGAAPKSPAVPNSAFADKPEAPVAETPAEKKRRIKYKVDGAEKEVDLDSLDDATLATKLQFAEAARTRMQEAAELKKAVQNLITEIKKDPFAALNDPAFGLDLESMAAERLKAKFREAQMSPEEQERLRLQKELEDRDAKLRSIEEEKKSAAHRELVEKIHAESEKEFMSALEAVKLPKNHHTLNMMADIAEMNLDHGLELTPQQMAAEVAERVRSSTAQVVKGLSDDQLVEYLGSDVVKRILKHSLAKVKPAKPFEAPKPAVDLDDDRPKREPKNYADVRKFFKLR